MRITDVRVHVVDAFRTNFVFLELVTDDGLVGTGEATLEYHEQAVAGMFQDLREDLLGVDATRITHLLELLHRDSYWRTGPVLRSAVSAIEMALLDLNGQALGVPVHRLLGGHVRDDVSVYANGWFAGARTPEDFAAAAQAATGRGFTALKFDPFGTAYLELTSAQLDRALALVGAVRAAVGPRTDLLIEGHGRFAPATAIDVARRLEEHSIFWFEEPCPPGSIDALVEIRSRSPIPIAAGERVVDRHVFLEMIRRGAVDFLQPDVSHAGGMAEIRRIADAADTRFIQVAPHNPSGPVATAATLHLAAAVSHFRFLEIMATDVPWRSSLTDEKLVFSDGRMAIPHRPGLGLSLRPDAFAAHPYRRHRLRHYTGDLTDIRPPGAVAYFGT